MSVARLETNLLLERSDTIPHMYGKLWGTGPTVWRLREEVEDVGRARGEGKDALMFTSD